MTEKTTQTASDAGAVPTRIQLDDFIEVVSSGVTRALSAQEEVSGYAMAQPRTGIGRPIVIGIYFSTNPSDEPGGGGSFAPLDPRPPVIRR